MTREEAEAWKQRWRLVRQESVEELRALSPEAKLYQLSDLMDTARKLGWTDPLPAEEAVVWERWTRLRSRLLG